MLRYKKTGDVTISLARAIAALTHSDTINGIPICKEFQNGACQRGQNACRFWHINVEEERINRFGDGNSNYDEGYGRPSRGGGQRGGSSMRGNNRRRPAQPRGGGYDDYEDYYPAPPISKRAHMGGGSYGGPDPHYVAELERHNAELSAELNSLKRELQREKERYDDLLLLLRNPQNVSGGVDRVPQPVAAPSLTQWPPQPPSMQDKYSWN